MNTGAPEPVEDLADGDDTVGLAEVGSDPDTPCSSRSRCRPRVSPTSWSTNGAWSRRPGPSPPGTGPVAVDAERASGYRYGQRAYLVQIRRAGLGHLADRPHRLPRPRAGGRGDRRRRVGAARGHAGPALPGRGGPAPGAAVRHRARRAPGRAAPRRPRRRRRALPRAQPGQGALGRRLVHPPAARAVAALRRARRRGARRAARRRSPPTWPSRASWRGRTRSSTPSPGSSRRRRARSSRGAAPPACTASATAAALAAGPRAVAGPRPASPRERDISPGRVMPDAAIDRRRKAARQPGRAAGACPSSRPVGAPAAPTVARRDRRAQALPEADLPPLTLRADGPPPRRAWADRDPDAAARLAAARRRAGRPAAGTPVPVENLLIAGRAAPAVLDPARARSTRTPSPRRSPRAGGPALAGRPGRARYRGRVRRHPDDAW